MKKLAMAVLLAILVGCEENSPSQADRCKGAMEGVDKTAIESECLKLPVAEIKEIAKQVHEKNPALTITFDESQSAQQNGKRIALVSNLPQAQAKTESSLNQYAQELAGAHAQVDTVEQIGGNGSPDKTYFVEITISGPESFWGGAQDWNAFASKVAYIGQKLLARQDVVRVRIISNTTASDGKPMGWAYADVERKKLPKDFQNFTYLEFASYANLEGGTLQADKWLCEFYNKYESAQPNGKLPYGCRD